MNVHITYIGEEYFMRFMARDHVPSAINLVKHDLIEQCADCRWVEG